ncbi:MAG: hypothetical protein B7X41_15095, partial [Microbacterium sp. 14-71-5]
MFPRSTRSARRLQLTTAHGLAWRSHQTMLINEYRLSPIDPKARKFLEEEME